MTSSRSLPRISWLTRRTSQIAKPRRLESAVTIARVAGPLAVLRRTLKAHPGEAAVSRNS